MKFKLRKNLELPRSKKDEELFAFLEKHIGNEIHDDRQNLLYFYCGHGWRIEFRPTGELHNTAYTLHIDGRKIRGAVKTELLLRWS